MKFADVVLPLPLEGTFTYGLPESLRAVVRVGMRVVVPLGRSKTYTAMVARLHDEEPAMKWRDILHVVDDAPVLLPEQLRLWRWIADYYMAPLGDVYNVAMPAGMKDEAAYHPRTEQYVELAPQYRDAAALHTLFDQMRRASRQLSVLMDYLALSHWDSIEGTTPTEDIREVTREELMNVSHATSAAVKMLTDRGILQIYYKEVGRLNLDGEPHPENVKPLSDAQQKAYDEILRQMDSHGVTLLHGVTSSGKTEIYIHLIGRTLSQGRQVLYLLPEIALTVQMTQRLQRVFGRRLGIYHSRYSDAERVEIWKKQLSPEPYDIILGARSAMFLPFQRLGLVIVDEEHESSFKQQDPSPRYHARSAAIMLARMCGAKTLLGSATPSAETYHNAMTGKYGLVTLSTRYQGISLPAVEIVDIKDLARRKMMRGPFSPAMLVAIREALDRRQQVIVFQNRRGYSPMIECPTCGWVPRCKNCDVSLSLHRNMNILTCHYCGYTYTVPKSCPSCGQTDLRSRGFGTEKIEDIIRQTFPEARTQRMDLDTTRTRNAYERIINDFSHYRTDVLIGTQMITKGLDFDRVALVGILDADTMLNYPDFRAYEQAFTMLTQVSGRAGRKRHQGRVILQTRNAQLPVVRHVVEHDFQRFFQELSEERREFHYPPFTHLVYVYLRHRKEHIVDSAARETGARLRNIFGTRVLGPDRPSVARVKNMYVRKLMVKLENGIDQKLVRQYLRAVQKQIEDDKRYVSLQIYYDVDPL
ncbi:MAG: primosomal protein N' [Prevotella sp.]|nr:primosomal protein N' [Prevotella sp.]